MYTETIWSVTTNRSRLVPTFNHTIPYHTQPMNNLSQINCTLTLLSVDSFVWSPRHEMFACNKVASELGAGKGGGFYIPPLPTPCPRSTHASTKRTRLTSLPGYTRLPVHTLHTSLSPTLLAHPFVKITEGWEGIF